MAEIYVSTDVETNGPIPGPYSMLSLGSAAYLPPRKLVRTFSVNLACLPEASEHPDTMRWWESHPEAWKACRRDPQPPEAAMRDYARWLKELPGKPVFVAYPAGFDFTFVYWYLVRFTGECPFSRCALDIRTYAMAMLKKEYRHTEKRSMPKRWRKDLSYAHVALDDAIEQGALFCEMLQENRQPS